MFVCRNTMPCDKILKDAIQGVKTINWHPCLPQIISIRLVSKKRF